MRCVGLGTRSQCLAWSGSRARGGDAFKEQQEAAGTEPKKAYAASLECIEALISDMTTGNLAPPKVKAPATATAKAAAPAAPPPADGGKKDKKSEADNANNPEGRQGVKKEKVKKAAPPKAEGAAAGERDIDVSWADIRVGKILEASKHPDSPKLYVEVIDLGEGAPRQVLSGLAEHMPLDQVAGAMVICICNLPARKMGGLESQAMVLCASDKDKTALCFVAPPEGSAPGDKVTWEGYPGEPEAPKKMQKKKAWEAVQPLLATSASGVAVYKEAPFSCPKGQCTATVKGGIIS